MGVLGLPNGAAKYSLIRDLGQRPAKPVEEDTPCEITSGSFVFDDRSDSWLGPWSKALQLKVTPKFVIPLSSTEKLEKELLEKELKFRGLQEKEIAETRVRMLSEKTKDTPW